MKFAIRSPHRHELDAMLSPECLVIEAGGRVVAHADEYGSVRYPGATGLAIDAESAVDRHRGACLERIVKDVNDVLALL